MKLQSLSRLSRHLLALGATALLVGAVHATPDAQFDPAFAQFQQANKGSESAIEKSAEAFVALLKSEPGNPVLLAYAGAATSMKATTTWLPWKKMSCAEDGLAMLDKALALLTPAHDAVLQRNLPAALEVKFVAANTFLAVPGFMNRGARGTKLLGEVLASPLFATSPLAFRGDVWLASAEQALKDKRRDDARKLLDAVIKANAPQAEVARAQLKAIAS
jgi:hypothetical protein